MMKLWPLLAIAAAVVGVAILVLGGGEDDPGPGAEDEVVAYDEQGNPILLTSEGGRRPRPTPPPATPTPTTEANGGAGAASGAVVFLRGRVVATEGGAPVAGAMLWAERVLEPCPRLPTTPMDTRGWLAAVDLQPGTTRTGPDGRFAWSVQQAPTSSRYDVFVSAPGYVPGCLCAVSTGDEVTVRLRAALTLTVQVTDASGRPVEAAAVRVTPAPGTDAVPGHGGAGVTDQDGRAAVDGLLPGAVLLTVDHPHFMPREDGPLDPAQDPELVVRLAPALRLSFEIRSDDASEVKNPTLAWATNGQPAHEGLTLLVGSPNGPPNAPLSEVRTAPVRVPCDHREVRFEVKADGFEPWQAPPEPLPAQGGERTVVLSLQRDTSLASLTVQFVDAAGKTVNYAGMHPVPSIMRLDERQLRSGIVLEATETLQFPALPAGPYRIGVRSPDYAPAETDVTVVAGESNQARITLGPPASLRLRFVAPERVLVGFRLLHQGRIVPAFPLDAPAQSENAGGSTPLVIPGGDGEGAVFTGLPAGALTIEVTSPELVAAPRTVQLRADETVEVEMEVQPR